MQSIRKKQGYLKELQERHRATTIGILGIQSGAGVTTMSISLAGYLSGFLKKRVAVLECGKGNAFGNMEHTERKSYFSVKGIDYYARDTISLSALEYTDYDIVVVDFGSSLSHIGDYLRCTHKIVMGTLEPWNMDRYEEFCQHIGEYAGSDLWLHILHGDERQLHHVMKTHRLSVVKRPFIDNVHRIDRNLLSFFQALF